MKTFKKLSLFIFPFILLFSTTIFSQNSIDFGQYNTFKKNQDFFKLKENKSDFAYGYYKTYEKGFWNGIPIKEVVLWESSLTFSISESQKNSTKKLVDYLEKKYPIELTIEKRSYSSNYKVNTEDFLLSANIDIEEDKKINENTKSKVEIKFKENFDNPFAKISSQIKSNPKGVNYYLDLNFFQVSPEIWINGLPFYSEVGKSRFMNEKGLFLNPYILNSNEPITFKFIINPGLDEDDVPYKNIIKESYFSAIIKTTNLNNEVQKQETIFNNQEYVTDTITKNGHTVYSSFPGTSKYGKKNIEFEHTFTPNVNYEIKGWNNGKDLRNEKDLEQKIKTFYKDFGELIVTKNIEKITELLYEKYADYYTYTYNLGDTKSSDDYSEWLTVIDNSFKVVLANQTKLHISTDGKLAYLESLDKKSFLKAVGKEYFKDIKFYFYIDKTTNQLKLIR